MLHNATRARPGIGTPFMEGTLVAGVLVAGPAAAIQAFMQGQILQGVVFPAAILITLWVSARFGRSAPRDTITQVGGLALRCLTQPVSLLAGALTLVLCGGIIGGLW